MIERDEIRNVLGERFDYNDPLWVQLQKCAGVQKDEIRWRYLERDAVLNEPVGLKSSVIVLAQAFLRGEAPLIFDPESAVRLIKVYQDYYSRKNQDGTSSILSLKSNWLPDELDFLEMSECWAPDDRTKLFLDPAAQNSFLPFLEESNTILGAINIASYYNELEAEKDSESVTNRIASVFWRYRAICLCLDNNTKRQIDSSAFEAIQNPYSSAAVEKLLSTPGDCETIVQDSRLFAYVLLHGNSDQLKSLLFAYTVVLYKHAPYMGIAPAFADVSLSQIISAICTCKPEIINEFVVPNHISVDWNSLSANDWKLIMDAYGSLFDKVFAPCFSDKTADANYFKQVCNVLSSTLKNLTVDKNVNDEHIHLSFEWPSLLIDTQYLKNVDSRFGVIIYWSKSDNLKNVRKPLEVAYSTFKRDGRLILRGGPKELSEYHFAIRLCFNFGDHWNDKPFYSKLIRYHYVPREKLTQIRWDLDFSKTGQELFITSCSEQSAQNKPGGLFSFPFFRNTTPPEPVGSLPALTLVKKLSTMPESISDGEILVEIKEQNSPRAWIPVDHCFEENDAKYRLFITNEEDKQEYNVVSMERNIRQKRYRSKELKCPYCLERLTLLDKLNCQYQCEKCAERLKNRRAQKDSDQDPRSFSPIISPSPSWRTRLLRKEIRCHKPECKDGTIVKPLCPHCGMPLPVDIWDYDATISIGLIGLPGTGKTTYRNALIAAMGPLGLIPATSDAIRTLSELAKLTAEYKLAPKTVPVSDLSKYLGLFRISSGGKQILIDLIDFAGEEFYDDKAVRQDGPAVVHVGLDFHKKIGVLTKADGLIAMVDPLQFQPVRQSVKKIRGDLPQAGADQATTMFQFVINWIRQGFVRNKRRIIPLAVTLSKIDLLKVDDASKLSPEDYALFPKGSAIFKGNTPAEEIDLIIRNFISGLDPALKSIVERRFEALKFFGISSLGTAPTKENLLHNKGVPVRVSEPFLWLLACNNVNLSRK